MSRISFLTVIILLGSIFFWLSGCEKDPLDPIQIGRFRPTPVVNIILDSLGVAEEEEPKFVDADDPKPIDLVELEQDYVLSAGDIITVNIFELLEEGVPYQEIFEISESGNISLPEVGTVRVAGLTEAQFEDELKQILSPTILKNPSVTVRTEQSPSRSFTILGEGLPRPGRYLLPGYTYRLADALAEAGSPRQFNVSYIYITRYEKNNQVASASRKSAMGGLGYDSDDEIELTPIEPAEKDDSEELLEIIAPHTSKNGKKPIDQFQNHPDMVIAASNAASFDELKKLAVPEDIGIEENENQIFAKESGQKSLNSSPKETRTEWIFQDGKWVAVEVGVDEAEEPFIEKEAIAQNGGKVETRWPEAASEGQTRVIKIPVKSLGVDPRYNVVIRPGDIITVPFNVVGEIVVMGNVNRQGYVDLTGRPMTLMQAIGAAGGLGELAEPSRVEVRRRVGEDREQIVMVDLDKIAQGLQPDFFIKENDTINVGTLPTSRFAAVLRNAFRATYGFEFIYSRNFADRDFLTSRPLPNIF